MRHQLLSLLFASAVLIGQQYQVVPSTFGGVDAPSFMWVAGSSASVRQQTLIDEAHVVAMLGRSITAIEFRRETVDETYAGGNATMAASLSTVAPPSDQASRDFVANVGANALPVFQGTVTLPSSPAALTTPPWASTTTVRIQFSQPFVYLGGTLVVDLTGSAITGQEAGWWMADAALDNVFGSTRHLGDSCGPIGAMFGRNSYVDVYDLVPGGKARFEAQSIPGELGILAFGVAGAAPIPLPLLGFSTNASCTCQLNPAVIFGSMLTVFMPASSTVLPPSVGLAEAQLAIPQASWVGGATMSAQWLALPSLTASNGIEFTIASSTPSLGMALVQGDPLESSGLVSRQRAHVMRFEYLP